MGVKVAPPQLDINPVFLSGGGVKGVPVTGEGSGRGGEGKGGKGAGGEGREWEGKGRKGRRGEER